MSLKVKPLFYNRALQSGFYDGFQINPSHTVPCLDDDGFIIWDSHTILVYLVEKYGQASFLWWTSPAEKYHTLQVLNFDCGTIFRRLSDCIVSIHSTKWDKIGIK